MPPYRALPKSVWRTIENWSEETLLRLIKHTKLSLERKSMDNLVLDRPWSTLIMEQDFCPNCVIPFEADKNPKVADSRCGHITCLSCSTERQKRGWDDCHLCGRRNGEKITLKPITSQERDRSRLIYELYRLARSPENHRIKLIQQHGVRTNFSSDEDVKAPTKPKLDKRKSKSEIARPTCQKERVAEGSKRHPMQSPLEAEEKFFADQDLNAMVDLEEEIMRAAIRNKKN